MLIIKKLYNLIFLNLANKLHWIVKLVIVVVVVVLLILVLMPILFLFARARPRQEEEDVIEHNEERPVNRIDTSITLFCTKRDALLDAFLLTPDNCVFNQITMVYTVAPFMYRFTKMTHLRFNNDSNLIVDINTRHILLPQNNLFRENTVHAGSTSFMFKLYQPNQQIPPVNERL